ncbi:MAG: LLM class flavin-dependent oxidoreductase [Deltaproteobacteria bacterium]|nr:LLM class flavin-dependent oxidoreductase [Deltaproteobacteria bacterium]
MKLSLFTEVQCPPGSSPGQRLQELVEQAERADALGFDGLWISEIHFQPEFSVLSAPYPVLAAISQRTRRLRLGVAVNILAVHHPVHVAEQAAMLDLLSGGRMDFTIGRGHPHTRVYEGFGANREESRSMMEESLKIIHGAWSSEPLEFHGRFYDIPEIMVNPKPVQKPHPPIYSANTSPDGVEFAAQLDLNVFLPIHTLNRERLKNLAETYWEKLRAHGHDRSQRELGLLVPIHIADSQEEARRRARQGILDYYRVISKTRSEYREWLTKRGSDGATRLPPVPWEGMSFEEICAEHAVLNDPEGALEELKALVNDTRATHLLCWMNIGSMTHDLVLQSMERFARSVMPALRQEFENG